MMIFGIWLYIEVLYMYLQATFKGWMDIMYAAVDSVNVSIDQPKTKLSNLKIFSLAQ